MADRSQLFDDIDSMEPERFTAHLADDVTMRFGNAEPIHGRDAVHDVWAGFCEGIDGVSHALVEQWESGSGTVWRPTVTYTRKDGGTVTVPVVTIYRERDGEIADYRIFIDLAPLFVLLVVALGAAGVGAVEGVLDVLGVGHARGRIIAHAQHGSPRPCARRAGRCRSWYALGSGGSGLRGRRPVNIAPSPTRRISSGQ